MSKIYAVLFISFIGFSAWGDDLTPTDLALQEYKTTATSLMKNLTYLRDNAGKCGFIHGPLLASYMPASIDGLTGAMRRTSSVKPGPAGIKTVDDLIKTSNTNIAELTKGEAQGQAALTGSSQECKSA